MCYLFTLPARRDRARSTRIETERQAHGVDLEGAQNLAEPFKPEKYAEDGVSSSDLSPMLAVAATEAPTGGGWTFEPKYDGIRVLVLAQDRQVAIVSRNELDKSAQFPEVAEAVAALSARLRAPLILDGEIVAIVDGKPARFQALQSRMHATRGVEHHREATPASLIAFDVLLRGKEQLVDAPWTERRQHLERVLRDRESAQLQLGGTSPDGDAMFEEARASGWEGLIAKRTDSRYRVGVRSRDWLKLKLERRQELVVGGYTKPRGSRAHLGALLVGYFDGKTLVYAGHVGGGFSRASLADMQGRLKPLLRPNSPFVPAPKTNEPAAWVEPKVVVEVRFNEWTSDGKLRQPVFVGVREDKSARSVKREPSILVDAPAAAKRVRSIARASATPSATSRIIDQLHEIEEQGGDGKLDLGREGKLDVTSLGKVFFPRARRTKGDLMRFYVSISPALLPAMRDRPLVLKRFPNGVGGPTFYQQRAPDNFPAGVRAEPAADDGELRLIGGNLVTLLYTVQLGAISVDPWHARVGSLQMPDYTVIDLDPGEGAGFRKVVQVALLVREELKRHGLKGVPKTSGASGMHVAVPLPSGVNEESARLLAELIATNVATRSPKLATVVRSVRARPRGTVYVDFLQNIRGKSVAGVYSVRAVPAATVSTPLRWNEVDDALDPADYTMDVAVERLKRVGDLWAAGMKASNTLRGFTTDSTPRQRSNATATTKRSPKRKRSNA